MTQPQQPQQPAAPAKPKSFAERLEAIEGALGAFQQIAMLVGNLRDAVGMEVQTLDAVIEVLGIQDQVTAKLAEKREASRLARNERSKKILEQLLKTKQIVAVETIDEDAILVGMESNANNMTTNEYVQTTYGNLVPEAKEKCLGQKVGFILEHGGTKLEIQGIYHMVAPPDQIPPLSETTSEEPSAPPAPTETTPAAPLTDVAPALATPETDVTPAVQAALAQNTDSAADAPAPTPAPDSTTAPADATPAPAAPTDSTPQNS